MSSSELKALGEISAHQKVDSSSIVDLSQVRKLASTETKLLLLKLELLKKIDLFSILSEADLTKLAGKSKDLVLEKDEILFEEGSADKKIYIILSGKIMVFKGRQRIKSICVLGQGDYLGEMSLIDGRPRSASTKAVCESVFAEIDEKLFNEVIASKPKALLGMMKIFSSRVRNDLESMEEDMKKVSNFTHDMRNCLVPLGIAEAHLSEISKMLHGTKEKHKQRSGWDKLRKSFDTMQSVKNNLLTMIDQSLACVKKTNKEYVKAEAEVIPLIYETVEEISCHKALKDKNIKVFADNKIRKARFNYLDIKRVLQNLVINAGHVSKKDGDIEIHLKALNDMILISVKDYGSGIPEDIKPLLLHENFTSKPDGNGFGLMSCKEIIEEFHQGEIYFESTVGEGTTFYFTLQNGS